MGLNGVGLNQNSSSPQINNQQEQQKQESEQKQGSKAQAPKMPIAIPGTKANSSQEKKQETKNADQAWSQTAKKADEKKLSPAAKLIKDLDPKALNGLSPEDFNSKMYELLEKGSKESEFFKKSLAAAKEKGIKFININNDPNLSKVVPKDVYGFHNPDENFVALSPTAIDIAGKDGSTKNNEYNRYHGKPFNQNFLSTFVNEASHLITDKGKPQITQAMVKEMENAVQGRKPELSALESNFSDLIMEEAISFLSSEMAESYKEGNKLSDTLTTDSIPGKDISDKELGKLLEYTEGYVISRFFDFNDQQQLQFANRVAGRIVANYESEDFHNKFQAKLFETGLVKAKAKSTYKYNPAFWNRDKK
jgi:hypothetical protein